MSLRSIPSAVSRVLEEQHSVIARRQLLAHGVTWAQIDGHVSALRWSLATPRVVCTVTGSPTQEQREWIAVLHAGPRGMLAGLTAAQRLGLVGWERDRIEVLVDDELSFEPVPGVDFFRSRRPFDVLRAPRPGVPTCRLEPSLLLWAGYEATVRPAHAVLAAAVQQRLTTPARLSACIEQLRPLRRAAAFRRTLQFVEGGAHSGAELDVERMCRRFGLPCPKRQVARLDRTGRRRWTDAEWSLPDGSVVILEVDGSFHSEVRQATEDARRTRRLVSRSRLVVRCTAYELLHEPHEVAADLAGLGVISGSCA